VGLMQRLDGTCGLLFDLRPSWIMSQSASDRVVPGLLQ
jgi:hypothetical protein